MSYNIVLTGGGTAGHVTPNIALIEKLQANGWTIRYIGSKNGIEQDMIRAVDIPFYGVSCGKLRRYFSLKNMVDPFKIGYGILQACFLLYKLKPDIVFSKGGFVAFPVVVAAWLNRIPVVAHESDMSPGLANRLSFPFAAKICLSFEAARSHFNDQRKIVTTGTPIRAYLLKGNKDKGLNFCGLDKDKPCLLIIGGSQGSVRINQCIRQSLDRLLQTFSVIHLCGKGRLDLLLKGKKGYCQLEYANKELADLYAASDIIVSRSGANSLCEILALNKPHILIPLSKKASRGDQIQNASHFRKMGISTVIDEDMLSPSTLFSALQDVERNMADRINQMKTLKTHSSCDLIENILSKLIGVG